MKREKLPYYKTTCTATQRIYIFARFAAQAGNMLHYGAEKVATFVNTKEGRAMAKSMLDGLNSIK